MVNKGGGDATAIGGSTADGYELPLFAIFTNDIIHLEDVEPHKLPTCCRPDPTNPGKTLPCCFWTNEKGGVTDDLGLKYIKSCVEPSLPGLSKDHPAVLIMDGHGSHFTFELLKHCQEIGLHILLRPPHTTHVLQDEDVVNFAVFKSHHQKTKQMALASKILHGGGAQLSPADLLLCARDAWQNAFSKANFLKAWADTGLVPFTRKVYLDLLEDEERKETRATALGVDLASTVTLNGMLSSMYPPMRSNP
jgi:hypothetical protein